MLKNWRKFIAEEYWPAGWPVGDPGSYGVEKCKLILRYWLERQKRGETPFQFHSYWTGGDNWELREPRRKMDDSDEYEDVAPKKRKKKTKRLAKGNIEGSQRSKPEKPTKSVPTTTARQSALSAMPKRPASKGTPAKLDPPARDPLKAPSSPNPITSSIEMRPSNSTSSRSKGKRKAREDEIKSNSDQDEDGVPALEGAPSAVP